MKLIDRIKIEYRFMKARRIRKRRIKLNLKILKICLFKVDELRIIRTPEGQPYLRGILKHYDDAISELNKDMDRYRKFLEE